VYVGRAKRLAPISVSEEGTRPFPVDAPQPFCDGCQVFIRYEDILATLLSTGEMRMSHYLCPNGIREVVFRDTLST